MTKDELLDEGRIQKEIAQDLADAGTPPRSALALGKWIAHITVEQYRIADLLSWLTIHVMSSTAKDGIKLGPDFFNAMKLVIAMREGAQQHIIDGFSALEHHHHMSKLLTLVTEKKWDEAIAHVKLSALGAKVSQD